MYLRRSRRYSPSQAMCSFFDFFSFVALLLSHIDKRNFAFPLQSVLQVLLSFKLDLVDLTVFPDLNLRLAKIKPLAKVYISKFSRFCCHASSFLCY